MKKLAVFMAVIMILVATGCKNNTTSPVATLALTNNYLLGEWVETWTVGTNRYVVWGFSSPGATSASYTGIYPNGTIAQIGGVNQYHQFKTWTISNPSSTV